MRQLFNYYRSSASYRVRIALNLKNLDYNELEVHLVKNGGEHLVESFKKINPQQLVPAYQEEDSTKIFTQSLAIIEYLEEKYPTPQLLPKSLEDRVWVRAFAQAIASDIHPLNNLRVLKYLMSNINVTEEQKVVWYQHWIYEGFSALESLLASHNQSGDFCHGDTPTIADICLVPQVYNAIRFNCDLSSYTRILKIVKHCEKIPSFMKAYPQENLTKN
jgi:maleylpyruvate isomerase